MQLPGLNIPAIPRAPNTTNANIETASRAWRLPTERITDTFWHTLGHLFETRAYLSVEPNAPNVVTEKRLNWVQRAVRFLKLGYQDTVFNPQEKLDLNQIKSINRAIHYIQNNQNISYDAAAHHLMPVGSALDQNRFNTIWNHFHPAPQPPIIPQQQQPLREQPLLPGQIPPGVSKEQHELAEQMQIDEFKNLMIGNQRNFGYAIENTIDQLIQDHPSERNLIQAAAEKARRELQEQANQPQQQIIQQQQQQPHPGQSFNRDFINSLFSGNHNLNYIETTLQQLMPNAPLELIQASARRAHRDLQQANQPNENIRHQIIERAFGIEYLKSQMRIMCNLLNSDDVLAQAINSFIQNGLNENWVNEAAAEVRAERLPPNAQQIEQQENADNQEIEQAQRRNVKDALNFYIQCECTLDQAIEILKNEPYLAPQLIDEVGEELRRILPNQPQQIPQQNIPQPEQIIQHQHPPQPHALSRLQQLEQGTQLIHGIPKYVILDSLIKVKFERTLLAGELKSRGYLEANINALCAQNNEMQVKKLNEDEASELSLFRKCHDAMREADNPNEGKKAVKQAIIELFKKFKSKEIVKKEIVSYGEGLIWFSDQLFEATWKEEEEFCKQGIRDSIRSFLQRHAFDEQAAKKALEEQALFPQLVDEVWGEAQDWKTRAQNDLHYDSQQPLAYARCVNAEGGISQMNLANGRSARSACTAFAARFLRDIAQNKPIVSDQELARFLNEVEPQFADGEALRNFIRNQYPDFREEVQDFVPLEIVKRFYNLTYIEPPRLNISQANAVLKAGAESSFANTSDVLEKLWDWLIQQPSRGGVLSCGTETIAIAKNGNMIQLFDSHNCNVFLNKVGACVLSFDIDENGKQQFVQALLKRFPPVNFDVFLNDDVPEQRQNVTLYPFLLQ